MSSVTSLHLLSSVHLLFPIPPRFSTFDMSDVSFVCSLHITLLSLVLLFSLQNSLVSITKTLGMDFVTILQDIYCKFFLQCFHELCATVGHPPVLSYYSHRLGDRAIYFVHYKVAC